MQSDKTGHTGSTLPHRLHTASEIAMVRVKSPLSTHLARSSATSPSEHRGHGPTHRRLKNVVRNRLGLEYGRYRYAVAYRRLQIMRHFGVDFVVDVGANTGQYASALRASGYAGRIVSFEPTKEPYEALATAAAADPKWDCRQIAVSDAPGELDFNLTRLSVFNSALRTVHVGEGPRPGPEIIGQERVVADTLDNLLSGVSTSGALAVKIDVQGFERQVLLGGRDTLARASVVEMELSPAPVFDAAHMLMREAIDRMADIGMVLSLVENILLDRPTGRALQFNGIFARFPDSAELTVNRR